MSVIEEVRCEREDLARVLKKHKGIRKLVEDLYPDRAHFIYELLQNAEDTGATETQFTLSETKLIFEHNGRPFDARDIYAITDIGEGTKTEDEDKIGRFGVGFKAVFAYCETPHIWSPAFSFKITELVLPSDIDSKPELGRKTRFEFPFNNPKKKSDTAYAEIRKGLEGLAETTLLFLSHLELIRWQIGQQTFCEVQRIQHAEHHVEILKRSVGKTPTSAHFLRFVDSVERLQKQHVAIAFGLDYLPNIATYDAQKPLAQQLKIYPAKPGRVAVFFPAENETSGLRFHLHAPFVTELSRASIKNTPVNDPLFQQLGELTAASLHRIRDLDLLTGDFLAVLPNPKDPLADRYESIRLTIISEMNNQPLTPTYSKSHAPANNLLQAKAALKKLLTEGDIKFLVRDKVQWAISAAQNNSDVDRFLDGLSIVSWDIEEFVKVLTAKGTKQIRIVSGTPSVQKCLDAQFMLWLTNHTLGWHQTLYALLYRELNAKGRLTQLKPVHFIRLSNHSYSIADDCYFQSDGGEQDNAFPRVGADVYTTGKDEAEQADAKRLLKDLGVREVGEAEHVGEILKQRYTRECIKPDSKDLRRFVDLVNKEPDRASLFADYFIFELKDGKWGLPRLVFLDQPFLETGLSFYYNALGDGASRYELAEGYQNCGISVDELVRFAKMVGVQTELESVDKLIHVLSTIEDSITGGKPNMEAIAFLWRTLCDLGKHNNHVLDHAYSYHKGWGHYGTQYIPSDLCQRLKQSEWVPQKAQTGFMFVCPAAADSKLLPDDFTHSNGWMWLKAIGFGEKEQHRTEEYKRKQTVAKELGFTSNDPASLERAKRFNALPPEEQENMLTERERRANPELPECESPNSERRSKLVADQAANAPERLTEERTRSVSVGLEEVKERAEHYLRGQYTDSSGGMICQVCKSVLPFQLDNGLYYFEKTEFLTVLRNRHYQNYLALCPDHAAMFHYANRSKDLMLDMFVRLEGNELDVVLAKLDETIYFTNKHIDDLKTIITVDQKE